MIWAVFHPSVRLTSPTSSHSRPGAVDQREGCFAGGPFLLPGIPLTFEVSCDWTALALFWSDELDPTVSPGFAAGPFLLPGCPAIPVPEFCALGAVDTPGLWVWASVTEGEASSARTTTLTAFMTDLHG